MAKPLSIKDGGVHSRITRDLKRSGRQHQGRLRLNNEFLPSIRISEWGFHVVVLHRTAKKCTKF